METDTPDTAESTPAAALGAELLTFLIADVRGYTAFTTERGDEAAAALADRFAELCDQVVSRYGGEVLELRGDEALATFRSARNALRAAVGLEETFRESVERDPSLPLAVGIGLDAGEAVPVKGGYRGRALNLAARLCSAAAAGDVFCTETVLELAGPVEGLAQVDRGEVTLKGLAAPVRVIQVGAAGELPEALPPLRTQPAAQPTNLPDEPTPFVGREREIEELVRLLQDPHTRLVTMTGPGGTGKTRLALQAGATVLRTFRDGVFLVDLAPLTDPALIPAAIAETLDVTQEAGKEVFASLTDGLSESHLLLVLDNYEHVLEASWVVASLLETCRELHVLVTSRMPLHLSREQEYPLQPLLTPDPRQLPDLVSLSRYEAIALFVHRARAVKPGFDLGEENARAIAEICHRLDGLPLAIELAAARIKLFPPQALVQRLTSRLTLLTGGARDRPSRQQTLSNAIEWSHNLLSPMEQHLFARLSVFVGGCSLEAAEAVCTAEGELDVLDGLASLVDKSLVRQIGEEDPRFSMLATIREYAAARLAERDETESLREAHAAYFLRLAEEAEPHLTGAGQDVWIRRLMAEYENIRAALGWFASTPGRSEQGLRLAGALAVFWFVRGLYRDGLEWLDRMLTLGAEHDSAGRVKALWGAGFLWTLVADEARARPVLETCLAMAVRRGDEVWAARALELQGLLAFFLNDHTSARTLFEASVDIARRAGDSWCVADALGTLSSIYPLQGEFGLAQAAGREALELARGRGDLQGIRMALFGLALTASRLGDFVAARTYAEEGLAISRDIGDLWFVSYFLWILSSITAAQGDGEKARALVDESLSVARQIEGPLLIVCALEASAAVARLEGNGAKAEGELAEAEELARGGMVPHSYLAAVLRARGELAMDHRDVALADRYLEESLVLSRQVGDRWSAARALSNLAETNRQRGEHEPAEALAREALAIQEEIEDWPGLASSRGRLSSIIEDRQASTGPVRDNQDRRATPG